MTTPYRKSEIVEPHTPSKTIEELFEEHNVMERIFAFFVLLGVPGLIGVCIGGTGTDMNPASPVFNLLFELAGALLFFGILPFVIVLAYLCFKGIKNCIDVMLGKRVF